MALPDRTIRWENRFAEEFAAIIPDAKRADEFIAGVEWKLSREPALGVLAYPHSYIWMLFMHELPGSPGLTIYYWFDEQFVYLLSIQVSIQGFG